MSGNVAEWEDDCDTSGSTPQADTCPPRGGGRASDKTDLACALSTADTSRGDTGSDLGIRCCAP